MAKKSGLGAQLYLDGYDLSGDTGSLDGIEMARNLLDVTGIDKSAMERLPGLVSGRLSFSTFFNDADDQQHEAMKALSGQPLAVFLQGKTLGDSGCGIRGRKVNYDGSRGADGSLTFAAEIQSDGFPAMEWGLSLTAGKRTDTGAVNGTGVSFGTGSTAFGLAAYLEVFAFTGTSVTVTIQESSDDGSTDPYAAVTGGAFTAVSAAPAAQRVGTGLTQTVERWLRAVTSGTFTNAVFAVLIKRYIAASGEV